MAARLSAVVMAVGTDVVLRRALRRSPHATLRDRFGLVLPSADLELGVRHHEVSVLLSEHALFGPPGPAPTMDAPVELVLTRAGAKPVAVVHGDEATALALVRWARARQLPAVLGPYEFDVHPEPGKGAFADLAAGRRPARPGSGAWRPVVVGARGNDNDVALAWLSLLFGWDEALGLLLGYPACCARSFPAAWQEAQRDHAGDLAALRLGNGPWELNVTARFLGPTLIQHFPCRPDCRPSLTLARRNLAVLDALAPATAERIRTLLPSPIVHAGEHGVIVFVGGRVVDDRIVFDPSLVETTDDGFWERFRRTSPLRTTELPAGATLVTFREESHALDRTA